MRYVLIAAAAGAAAATIYAIVREATRKTYWFRFETGAREQLAGPYRTEADAARARTMYLRARPAGGARVSAVLARSQWHPIITPA